MLCTWFFIVIVSLDSSCRSWAMATAWFLCYTGERGLEPNYEKFGIIGQSRRNLPQNGSATTISRRQPRSRASMLAMACSGILNNMVYHLRYPRCFWAYMCKEEAESTKACLRHEAQHDICRFPICRFPVCVWCNNTYIATHDVTYERNCQCTARSTHTHNTDSHDDIEDAIIIAYIKKVFITRCVMMSVAIMRAHNYPISKHEHVYYQDLPSCTRAWWVVASLSCPWWELL